MKKSIAGFDVFEVEFNRQGEVNADAQVRDLSNFIGAQKVTDLLVFSHGWNNDEAEARQLYSSWLASARAVLDDPRKLVPAIATRKLAMMAVLWPSKRFADSELIPGGVAGLGAGATNPAALAAQLEDMKRLFTEKDEKATLDTAKALLPHLDKDPKARKQFVEAMRSLMNKRALDAEDGSDQVMKRDPEDVFASASAPIAKPKAKIDPEAGGVATVGSGKKPAAADAGGAAGL